MLHAAFSLLLYSSLQQATALSFPQVNFGTSFPIGIIIYDEKGSVNMLKKLS
jgi:hypothetical protein